MENELVALRWVCREFAQIFSFRVIVFQMNYETFLLLSSDLAAGTAEIVFKLLVA